ncbi:MAG TPA: hypothetical protein VGN26_20500 [Armatimonadota bacterium]|jgi:hypothetical protein
MPKEPEGTIGLGSLTRELRDIIDDLQNRLEILEGRVSWAEEYIRHQEMDKETVRPEGEGGHPRHKGHI